MKTLLVVPCYNEERRLSSAAFQSFASLHPDIAFLFVNDGSSDRTEDLLYDLCSSLGTQGQVLSFGENRGKAEAVRLGILQGMKGEGYSYVGYWDADLATPLEEVISMEMILEEKPHVMLVMGARVKLLGRSIQRKAMRHYLGRVFATVASNVLGLAVYDTQCGAKLFRCESSLLQQIFQKPFLTQWVFDVELVARLQACLPARASDADHFIFEYPLVQWQDMDGSKVRPWHFAVAALDLVKICWHYRRGIASKRQTDF